MSEQDTLCNLVIDYTQFGKENLLPFRVTLDLEHSKLLPAPGETQEFCYVVTGTGSGSPESADLCHLVLGVCGLGPAEPKTVAVSVDGEDQDAVLGRNVQLLDPDPETGCSGMKFSFPLSRSGGRMKLRFTLGAPCAVGSVPVSLFGESVSVSGLRICGPVRGKSLS